MANTGPLCNPKLHRGDAACCKTVQISSAIPEQCRAFGGTVENSPVVQPRVNVGSEIESGF